MDTRLTKLVVIFLFLQIIITVSKEITIYELTDGKGKQANVDISSCTNLPISLVRNVESVNTRSCVRLYDDVHCSGNLIDISPRSPSHNDLKLWNFANKVVSAGPCPEPCLEDLSRRTSDFIELYAEEDYKGSHIKIHLNGCSTIPTKFVNSTLSLKASGNCIRFYSTTNCDLETTNVNFIDLPPNSPHHNNLAFWKFPMKKSISKCSYSCDLSSTLLNDHCVNVENATQEDLSQTKISKERNCVTHFSQLDCTGKGVDVMIIPNITLNFDGTKSIKRCSTINDSLIISKIFTTISPNEEQNPSSTTHLIDTKRISRKFNETLIQGNHSTQKNDSKSQQTYNLLNSFPAYTIMIIIVVPVASVLLSIFVVCCVLRRWYVYKRVVNKLSDKEIREFLGGFELDTLTKSGNATIGNEYSTELLAQKKPFNKEYEITRSRIEFDSEMPLGKGEFGVVYKGTVAVANEPIATTSSSHQTTDRITVAIKMINSSSGLHGLRSLLKEVKVMLYVGEHVNIARIIGCCTENLRKGEIMVLTEFCAEGSLESYLSKHRHLYNSFVTNGRLEFQDESDTLNLNSKNFDIFQLAKWCAEIASGMQFLSSAKVVHSDLAARNILLNGMVEAKISDFGLSRQLYNYTQYMKKQQEPLPWRWMAIESLRCLEFSTKSDVWSYGILCWEIFTLGEKPYPNLGWNESFVSTLENGFRLPQPQNSTNEFYDLMHRCWQENPKNRPSFSAILREINELILNYDAIRTIPCKIESICIQIN